MAHCTKCGAAVAEGAGFCPACGAPQAAAPAAAGAAPPAAVANSPAQSQMAENTAATLSYVLGWITGLIFYFIDKRPYVRFHASQSIVVFGGVHILWIVLGAFIGFSLFSGGLAGFSIGWALYGLIGIALFVLWIVLMIKAYQGVRFRVPIAADIAQAIFKP